MLRQVFGQFWEKAPTHETLALLLEKRPLATVDHWRGALKDIASEQERAFLPPVKTVLAAIPHERPYCEVCDERRCVEVVGFFVDGATLRKAGLGEVAGKRTASGEAQVLVRNLPLIQQHGVPVRRQTYIAYCDNCGAEGDVKVSDCFGKGGSHAGYVEIAGMGPGYGEPVRQAAIDLVMRVIQWRTGQPCAAGYTDRLTAREWLAELNAGADVRKELRDALDGATTLGDAMGGGKGGADATRGE